MHVKERMKKEAVVMNQKWDRNQKGNREKEVRKGLGKKVVVV